MVQSAQGARFTKSLLWLGVAILVFLGLLTLWPRSSIDPVNGSVMTEIMEGRQELRQVARLATNQSAGDPATQFGRLPIRGDRQANGTSPSISGEQAPSGNPPTNSDTIAAESPVDRGDIEAAINLIDSGKVDEAVRALKDILRRDPNNEAALVEMAMVNLLDLRQPGEAINYLQRVMEVNPSNRIVMSELVSLYEEEGRSEEGLAFLQEMQATNPEAGDIAYGIGQMLTLQGRDQEAIPHLEKAATNGGKQRSSLPRLSRRLLS